MELIKILNKQILFLDGGTGSVLQSLGLKPGELPENWNISHSKEIVQLGYSYYLSGSNIINTNTFGAFSIKFNDNLEQIITHAFKNANEARSLILQKDKENGKNIPRFISFDIGSCGKLLKPLGDLDFEDCISLYKKTFYLALKHNSDAITIETMNDIYEAKAAVIAAKEVMEDYKLNIPIFVSMVYDESEKTLTGSSPEICSAILESLGVSAIGLNCSLGPEQMKNIVKRLLNSTNLPIIVKPNAGLPRSENGKTIYDVLEDEFAKSMSDFAKKGAALLGGCCGTTPSYIKKMILEIQKSSVLELPLKSSSQKSVITSGTKLIEFGKTPILIGERINPTGKKKLKEALKTNDIAYILNEAITQEENGAQVLDVNVGLPEIDECSVMQNVIKEIQSVTDLPLQIDTSDCVTMEKAMRLYNGKPLINSVNGKQSEMDKIFPLVKKYGGMVIALTLDENGIPETYEGRIEIVEKIYKEAKKWGIDENQIIIDPLAMTVSADDKAALATLKTVKYVKEQKNGLTSLGVSNVSFGLPLREHITSTFFTMAMQNGLSAAIMNPSSIEMKKAWVCFKTLSGMDAQCLDYINFAGKYEEKQKCHSSIGENLSNKNIPNQVGNDKMQVGNDKTHNENLLQDPLIKAIVKGLKEKSRVLTQEVLNKQTSSLVHGDNENCHSSEGENLSNNNPTMDIINKKIIPALDIIGKDFEQKKAYLPQLLMAAEAAKEAFSVIKEEMSKTGLNQTKKSTIVIATVKGDIHDIGKNIVKVLLENYSFNVIDLGKDVAPQTILQAVIKEHAPLCGLSALMTTTVGAMEETIKLIHKDAPWCKVFVGGAVLNSDYAKKINADAYTKDAMESVKYCQSVC